MSASGAPRNIEGIASRNVWVTARAIIKTPRTNGVVNVRKKGDNVNKINATKFVWMPGVKPEIIPKKQPRRIAIIIW